MRLVSRFAVVSAGTRPVWKRPTIVSASPALKNTPAPTSPPSSWFLLRVWLLLSLQSFGGGPTTLALVRHAVVHQHHWMTDEEFARDWAICQVCPGINLFCMTILVGRRAAGVRGIFLCLMGLLVPSVAVTIVITAFYAHIRDLALVKAALQAVIPASVGLGFLAAVDIARAPLRESKREGAGWVFFAVLLLVGSGAALLLLHPPVVLILAGAGVLSGAASWLHQKAAEKNRGQSH